MNLIDQIKTLIPEELHSYVDYVSALYKEVDAKFTISMEKKGGKIIMSGWSQGEVPVDALEEYAANVIADIHNHTATDEEKREERKDVLAGLKEQVAYYKEKEKDADLKAHGARLDWADKV